MTALKDTVLVWGLVVILPLVIILGACFVGFVKFMAWWRVAFGDCSP